MTQPARNKQARLTAKRGAASTAQPVHQRASTASSPAAPSISGVTTRRGQKRAADAAAAAATAANTSQAKKKQSDHGRMAGGMDDGGTRGRSASSGRNSTNRSRSQHTSSTRSNASAKSKSKSKKKATNGDLNEARERVKTSIRDLRASDGDSREAMVESVREKITLWLPLYQRVHELDVSSNEVARLASDGKTIRGVVTRVVAPHKGDILILMSKVKDLTFHMQEEQTDPPKVPVLVEQKSLALANDLVHRGIPFVTNDNRLITVQVSYPTLDADYLVTQGCDTFEVLGINPGMTIQTRERIVKFFAISSITHGSATNMTVVLRSVSEAKLFAAVFNHFHIGGSIIWLRARAN